MFVFQDHLCLVPRLDYDYAVCVRTLEMFTLQETISMKRSKKHPHPNGDAERTKKITNEQILDLDNVLTALDVLIDNKKLDADNKEVFKMVRRKLKQLVKEISSNGL